METNGEFFADKLMDLANYAVAALVFGQLIGAQTNWLAAVVEGGRNPQ